MNRYQAANTQPHKRLVTVTHRFLLFMTLLSATLLIPSTPSPVIAQTSTPSPQAEVRIIIEQVNVLDDVDGPGGDPDFYAVVTIDGKEANNKSGVIDDDSHISPNWQFFETVAVTRTIIPISINIFDEDGFLRFDDEQIDIAPNEGRALDVSVDLQPCDITGDGITGTCTEPLISAGGEENSANITFRVEVRQPVIPGKLKLVIERVRALDCFGDTFLGACITDTNADFYARVRIDGQELGNKENYISDQNDISPNWEFRKDIDLTKNIIPLAIDIYDEDDGDDDHADIQNRDGRTINVTINVDLCMDGGDNALIGDITGKCLDTIQSGGTSDEKAEIFFKIEITPPPSTPGTNVRCTHSPIWPQPGEQVTVTADALDGALGPKYNADIEIWINNRDAPVQTGSDVLSLTASSGPFDPGEFISYRCVVSVKSTGEKISSGWRRTQIELPAEGRVVPILYTGSRSSSIDIVFVADRGTYDGPSNAQFLADVHNIIKESYYGERLYLAHQDKVNFWLALDQGRAEEFGDGCDHEWPGQYKPLELPTPSFGEYAFADTTAIVHRNQERLGRSFRDCAPSGQRVFSGDVSDGNWQGLYRHETGHRPFGLSDEYCNKRNPPAGSVCDGGYFQNNPFPNLYEEPENCIADITNLQIWDERLYQPQRSVADCKEFEESIDWWFDVDWSVSDPPSNDLMVDNTTVQGADARRMDWLLTQCDQALCSDIPLPSLQADTYSPNLTPSNDPQLDTVPELDNAVQAASKTLNIRLDFTGRDQAALNRSQMASGQTYTHLGDPPLLHVRFLDKERTLIKEYNEWHPLWTFVNDVNGEHLTVLPQATGNFIASFTPQMKFMEVYDVAQQKHITTINIESSIIRPFCEQNPTDVDCQNYDFDNRIVSGLQALYTFDEKAGPIVNDVSGVGQPLNLKIADPATTQWTEGGLRVASPSVIASDLVATKIIDAARTTNELTIEAWVTPASTESSPASSIVTLSTDSNNRNVSLEQEATSSGASNRFAAHLRTANTATTGTELKTSRRFSSGALTHVVFTRNAAGISRLYVNGIEQKHKTIKGDFSTWDSNYRLVFANELTGALPWLGEYQLVAFYNQALNAADVRQNFFAGPDGDAIVCYATADKREDGKTDQFIVFSDGISTTAVVDNLGTEDIEALTFQPKSNTLYAVNADQLGTIDLSTGIFSPTAEIVGTGRGIAGTIEFKNIDGLAFEQTSGTLYGVHRRSGNPTDREVLFTIDPISGKAIPNAFGPGIDYLVIDGPGLLPDVDDIVIEPQTGQIYATSDTNGQGGTLITIDKMTGAATVIGAYGVNDIDGLTFTESGQLYGITGNSNKGNTTDSRIYTINTTTGQTAEIHAFDSVRDYESAACDPPKQNAVKPIIQSIQPKQGQSDQAKLITITGANFTAGMRVYLGSRLLNTQFINTTQIQAHIPAGLAPGLYTITIMYPDGRYEVFPSAYIITTPSKYIYVPFIVR